MNEENQQTQDAFSSYEEAVEWITGLVPVGIRPGLKRMETMMEMLGHPERRLRFIHVGGTNGKGSTCAYLTKVLVRAGYDVGTFTSPYLERFTSRLRYNEKDIPDEDLLRMANRVKPIADELAQTELGHPTMFEVTTAVALLYYGTVTYPDYVVWEVGLGGRLDSTNIVAPVVSVITNVGHDHMDVLGDTIEKVAFEKAGIIKPGVAVVSAVEQPEAVEVLEQACRERKCSLYLLDREFRFEAVSSELNRQEFDFESPFRRIEGLAISMNGYHQYKNAAVAVMVLEVLRQYYALLVEDEDLNAALYETQWPGRLEMIGENPRILIDGAHNPEGAEMLADAIGTTYPHDKVHLMMGMLATKEHSGYLKHILAVVDTLVITEPDFRKKMDAEKLAELARSMAEEANRQIEIVVEPDWKQALARLKAQTGPDDLAVVSGTLYLISDVRSWVINRTDSEKGW
ncbi:bifunctional folylpolyglutamate synthase/dihydrofolate synthase [Paenibacillus sp. J31TS4]|nr:folylpolyglutamate synthase/dihydrofolate synthase family protein [Paenibacillus sp. J31TS4]GIP39191.1 bifunctional folylpolyglutamate synthase/dihydrofolate synthase [Paenibacillus sp. J31TS4]